MEGRPPQDPVSPAEHDVGAQEQVSVVIPARNAASTIGEQLSALSRQSFDGPWEVVVVDDASTDRTADIVTRWADRLPRLTLRSLEHRQGEPRARNEGTRAARGKFVAYCDADDVVSEKWLEGIVETLEDQELATGPIDLALLNASKTFRWRGHNGWEDLPDWHLFLPGALGCNLGVRRETFDRVGGFDESCSIGCDFDFEWRAQLEGARLGFDPDAVVHRRERKEPYRYFQAYVGYGWADTHHYSRFKAHGMPRRLGRGILRLALLLPTSPILLVPSSRYRWLASAGTAVGHVWGSWAHRVLYL
jgi:glycosyltransferase involved in cell wall biosynthesis